ncbi:hypothetical protein [Paenibacillus herberti]|uniref:Uncharacterized protein n=1 Tax=Paenibacillus herberti TaxID=1619309 RepID=A0A229NTE2_9BACL|nr:hypothetical protein [Paenibacillus herberti]OXM13005.1 hypothetical protein CGZ75_22740 [Paenibacillus herberti]
MNNKPHVSIILILFILLVLVTQLTHSTPQPLDKPIGAEAELVRDFFIANETPFSLTRSNYSGNIISSSSVVPRREYGWIRMPAKFEKTVATINYYWLDLTTSPYQIHLTLEIITEYFLSSSFKAISTVGPIEIVETSSHGGQDGVIANYRPR